MYTLYTSLYEQRIVALKLKRTHLRTVQHLKLLKLEGRLKALKWLQYVHSHINK